MTIALNLFYQKGYEHTTVNDIIHAMGLSKGSFYHYFESKEDVIISIARDYAQHAVSIMEPIFKQTRLNALEKLNQALLAINQHKAKERTWRNKFKGALQSEANLKLQHKIIYYLKQEAVLLFKNLFEDGYRQGIFGDPLNSSEMADFFLNTIFNLNRAVDDLEEELVNSKNSMDFKCYLSKLQEKVQVYEVILERMLQLKPDSLDLFACYKARSKGLEQEVIP